MDKEKFIKRAEECGYSNGEIKEMIQDYENDLKNGIEFDLTDFLIDWHSEISNSPARKPDDVCHSCPHFFRYPSCPFLPDFEECLRKEELLKEYEEYNKEYDNDFDE